ncbi:formate nitrite transporter [Micractinium conductrix]|uniref:Formate nitrite transporter n=1 Tax=Micractinium conductrix TaxID=554055 RepID=A0A2P6V1F8_9CHLO|nr:formate nitrite transporter [Micractinium conductrix]|eukprot:PSC67913.1 formate nitrite transporter [Micractinium conductrix]
MQTATASGLRAQLPARRVACGGRTTRVIVCRAQQQQQKQQPQAPFPSAATAAALGSLLAGAPAWAEEADGAAAAAAAANDSFAPLGVTPIGWLLTLSPVIFYLIFNGYRSFVDPKAKFGDAVFAFAALLILTNIICITVFKIRIW